MRRIQASFLAWLLLAGSGPSAADLVVIVNAESGVEALTREDVVNVFMGRYRKLPSGVTALPVDQAEEKAAFYKGLLNKELPEVQSYWARLVFSGQGSPPQQVENTTEVIEVVINNKGAVGYIDRANLDERVKIVLDLSRLISTHP